MDLSRIRRMARYSKYEEYLIDFFGDDLFVTVTPTPSVIRRWISTTIFNHRRSRSNRPLVVGVCVQWTPRFSSPDSSPDRYYSHSPPASYDPPADTLQLCVGRRCIIIQLSHCNRVPLILRRFLADSLTTFVGVWNSQDAGKLERSRHELDIGKLLDVRKFVEDSEGRSLRGCSFEQIVEECMGYEGVRLEPKVSMSDWSVFNLDLDQVLQASVKAFVCCKLGVSEKLWRFD